MERYICIHGHFYQPPRENPWLEDVELQDSAYPYHDWNERITAECYAPNAAVAHPRRRGPHRADRQQLRAHQLQLRPDAAGVAGGKSPDIYDAILDADRRASERFSGHGSAIAQVYNHIDPAARQPRATNRRRSSGAFAISSAASAASPEGMWLPETAVDLETLDVLAEQGSASPILVALPGAAHAQARRRRLGGRRAADASIRRRPIAVTLPSGRRSRSSSTTARFRRRSLSSGCSTSGENLADRLVGASRDARPGRSSSTSPPTAKPTATIIATATWPCLRAASHREATNLARLTNYGEYLAKHPPTHEAEIIENTRLELRARRRALAQRLRLQLRRQPGWNQEWRAPLRDALDWLRDAIAPRFETKARELLRIPGRRATTTSPSSSIARPKIVDAFFEQPRRAHARRRRTRSPRSKLLEMQRHAMLMYTSCGWFFDELSGIETVQVIQYAARAIQLSEEVFGDRRAARSWTGWQRRRAIFPNTATAASSTRSSSSPRWWTAKRWRHTTR